MCHEWGDFDHRCGPSRRGRDPRGVWGRLGTDIHNLTKNERMDGRTDSGVEAGPGGLGDGSSPVGSWGKGPVAYFHSPADYRTSTESEAVIGRALCDVGHLVTA